MSLTSSHSNLERVQHAIGPSVAVHPLFEGYGLSGWDSPKGHWNQFWVRWLGHHASTFLHPFAPPAFTGFNATMSALTPAPSASPIRQRHRSPGLDQGSSVRSASNHQMMHITAFLLRSPFSRDIVLGRACAVRAEAPGIRFEVRTSPFPSRLAASKGRIEFVACGPDVRLGLLSTPACGGPHHLTDAVTSDYGPRNHSPARTCTSLNLHHPQRTGTGILPVWAPHGQDGHATLSEWPFCSCSTQSDEEIDRHHGFTTSINEQGRAKSERPFSTCHSSRVTLRSRPSAPPSWRLAQRRWGQLLSCRQPSWRRHRPSCPLPSRPSGLHRWQFPVFCSGYRS